MKITQYNLEENGWDLLDLKVWKTWQKKISLDEETFYLEIYFLGDHSNLPDRDWVLHIDNSRHESVGSFVVSDYEQFYEFLEVLTNSKYKNPITEEKLALYGWEKEEDAVIKDIDPELAISWTKTYDTCKDGLPKYYLRVSKVSNIRDWSVHIDNSDHDSVAGMDIYSFEQITKLLKLLSDEGCY